MIRLIQYTETQYQTYESTKAEEILQHYDPQFVNWFDVEINYDNHNFEKIAAHFNLHHLILEDITNIYHLPKLEIFEDYYFLTIKMLKIREDGEIEPEQLSLILSENLVLSFQEGLEGDVFDELRRRIGLNIGRVRKNKADYLFYRIIDTVVDKYVEVSEYLRQRVEDLEDYLFENPNENIVPRILEEKKTINVIRKFVVPLQNEIARLKKEPSKFIRKATLAYFQDVYDHLNHIRSGFEIHRDMLNDLIDLYMSNVSYGMNNIMKILTVISSIFIPLTFIAGVYGMNFRYMPELQWQWGYPAALLIMLIVALGMVCFIKYKKWL